MWAKQSTAATVIVGPILDSSGAEFTTAVIGDLSISKNGGTLTALSGNTFTHIANGQYTLTLTTGNLDTLGRLQITCNKSTYQMPELRLMVVPAHVFDGLILGTDFLQVDAVQVANVTLAASQPDYAPLLASSYTAPANSDIAAIRSKTDNLPSDPADQSLIMDATNAVMARLGAPVGASMSADIATRLAAASYTAPANSDIAAIKARTDNLPANTATTLSTIDTWVKRNAVILSGTIATAGTASEVFTISSLGITATIAVDADGNRSSVTWS